MKMNNLIKLQINNFIGYLIILFPIFMIFGSFLTNLFSILLSVYSLINFKKLKNIIFSNEKIFFFLIFLFIFIFPYNSINFERSIIKYLYYFKNILMFFGIIIFLDTINSEKFLMKVKKIYLGLLILIIVDVLKEYFSGTNFLGFNTDYSGRIASFTGSELIIGYIFSFLILFSFGYFFNIKINKLYFILIFYILIVISFLIGERSNFLKLILVIIIFSSFHYFVWNKFKFSQILNFIILIILLITSFLLITKNTIQAKKLYNFQLSTINNDSENVTIKDSFYKSKHAPHYITAIKIFLNYPIFGIGIDNFSTESKKQKYSDARLKYSKSRSSTHPHQIYLEILAEVGIIGFIYYILIFFWAFRLGIKTYLKERNINLLGHIMLHIFFIFPILPSGSFFGTVYGLPFWFNLSILIYLSKKKEIRKSIRKIT